jgi:hypothetical protein
MASCDGGAAGARQGAHVLADLAAAGGAIQGGVQPGRRPGCIPTDRQLSELLLLVQSRVPPDYVSISQGRSTKAILTTALGGPPWADRDLPIP